MFRTVLILAAFLWTGLAAAQEQPSTLDHVAAAFLGAADGSETPMGGSATATFERTAPGQFNVVSGGTTYQLAVEEIEPCIFMAQILVGGANQGGMHIDATDLGGIAFEFKRMQGDLEQYLMKISGLPAMLHAVSPEGQMNQLPTTTTLTTSLEIDALQAAATAIEAACPPG